MVLEAQYAIGVVRIHFLAMMYNYAPCEVQHCSPAKKLVLRNRDHLVLVFSPLMVLGSVPTAALRETLVP